MIRRLACVRCIAYVAVLVACGPDGASKDSNGAQAGADGNEKEPSAAGGAAGSDGALDDSNGAQAGADGNEKEPSAAGGAAGTPGIACVGTARYKVLVELTWDDPSVQNRHFTTVVGATHAADLSLWKIGELATPGIKAMAETGATTPLDQEVEAASAAGKARRLIRFAGGDSPGRAQSVIALSPEFSQVSFGSMLAPSPDWFIGVSGFDLCQGGTWVSRETFNAVAHDAGTKDGNEFTYGQGYTSPPMPIELQPILAPGGIARSFGTIGFERVE